ncbi:Ni/Fe hydrogenase subunit alpha [Candidatus Caldatribacterium sp. SIUC1]|uniref:Ni/Fe hydrogenase subunit alpha n=1 Tax=Candidatus Caldatribacterium sp. SIUC1 TaxID=3418365 RepID=UPI003F68E4F7
MGKSIRVDVEYLTRVEGHGNIVVDVRDGTLRECRLEIIESPRFFEGMLRGRSIFEAQHITSRICGICACAHSLASIQAAEEAIGFVPSEQTVKLRKFLLDIEILDSHILHIYFLVAPDLLGAKSFVPLVETHNAVVRRALRLKKTCNDVCDILVGRHVHPISCTVGGFTKLPRPGDLEKMRSLLLGMVPDLEATVDLVRGFRFPEFERETEYVALVSDDDEYPLLMGDIGSTDGVRLPKKEYRKITNEFVVPHSTAKHTRLSRDSYMVGALARLNLNYSKLHPRAKEIADLFGMNRKVTNPYLNTVAQLVECFHCLYHAVDIVEEFLKTGLNYDEEIVVGLNEKQRIPVRAGSGVGAVEAPRGTLYHHYEVDDHGRIVHANCVIPTGQNLRNIEYDMRKLVPEILDQSEEEIQLALEMLVRAYDPCISCSTHFLNVTFVGRDNPEGS